MPTGLLVSRRLTKWNDPATRVLLQLTVGNLTPEKLDEIREWYAAAPEREIDVLFLGEQLIGLLGTERLCNRTLIIRHIAVATDLQGNGYGRRIIEELSHRCPDHALLATTDLDAVEFYRRCGFKIRALGKNTYGRDRFECRHEAINSSTSCDCSPL